MTNEEMALELLYGMIAVSAGIISLIFWGIAIKKGKNK